MMQTVCHVFREDESPAIGCVAGIGGERKVLLWKTVPSHEQSSVGYKFADTERPLK